MRTWVERDCWGTREGGEEAWDAVYWREERERLGLSEGSKERRRREVLGAFGPSIHMSVLLSRMERDPVVLAYTPPCMRHAAACGNVSVLVSVMTEAEVREEMKRELMETLSQEECAHDVSRPG